MKKDDLVAWLTRGGVTAKQALNEGGAQLALRLLQGAHARQLPPADSLRPQSSAVARLHNWNLLLPGLGTIGIALDADRKAMVVAGDASTTIAMLRAIFARLPSNGARSSGAAGPSDTSAQEADRTEQLMVDMAADGPLDLPVLPSDVRQIATDIAVSPASARSVAEFFVICACQQLGLDPEEAARALRGAPGRQPMARLLVEGIGSAPVASRRAERATHPVERFMQQVHGHCETLAALVIASLRRGSASARRHGAMFLPALCTLAPALSSESGAVAAWAARVFDTLARALVRADARFATQLSRWFRGHSLRGACPAPWNAAAGLVRFVEQHCGAERERERGRTLAQEVIPMIALCVAEPGHMRDLFGSVVTRAVPQLVRDEQRVLRFARRLVPSLAAHGGCRAEFVRSGGAVELVRAALRGASAEDGAAASFALVAEHNPTTTMRDANDETRLVAIALLAELWRGFPESIEGGSGGGGDSGDGYAPATLSLQVLAELRRAVRRGSSGLQTTAVHSLFLVMRSLARRRSSLAGVVFKTIVFALVERPLIDGSGGGGGGIHTLICGELKRLLPVYKRAPLAILVVPLVKQAALLGGRFLDFSLLAIIATHSALSLRHGILLLDALSRISLNDSGRARDAKNPFIALAKRFGERPAVFLFLCRTATVAIVTLADVSGSTTAATAAVAVASIDAPSGVEKRALAAAFLRIIILLDVQSAVELPQSQTLGVGAEGGYGFGAEVISADPQPCLNRWLAPRLMLAVARMRAQSDAITAAGGDGAAAFEADARSAEVVATVRGLLRLTKVAIHEEFARMRENAETISAARRLRQQQRETAERHANEVRTTLRRERELRASEARAVEEQAEWERQSKQREQQRLRAHEMERREREEQRQQRMDEEMRREEEQAQEEWEQQMRERQLERRRRQREMARREHEKRVRLEEELRREEEEGFYAERAVARESSKRAARFREESSSVEKSPGGEHSLGTPTRVLTTIFSDEDDDGSAVPTRGAQRRRQSKATVPFESDRRALVMDEAGRLDAIESGAADDHAFWSGVGSSNENLHGKNPLPVLFNGLAPLLHAIFKAYSAMQSKSSIINRPTSFDDIGKSASSISVGEWVRLLRDFCIINQRTALSMRRVEAQELFRRWCGVQTQDVTFRRFLGLIAHLTKSEKFARALDKRPFLGDIKGGPHGRGAAYTHAANGRSDGTLERHALFRRRLLTLLRHMRSVVVDERRRRGMGKSARGASSSSGSKARKGSQDLPRPLLELRIWRTLKPYDGISDDDLAAEAFAHVASPLSPINRAKTPGSPYRSSRSPLRREESPLPPQSDSERSWRDAQRRVQLKHKPADETSGEGEMDELGDPEFIAQLVDLYRAQAETLPPSKESITVAQVQEGLLSMSTRAPPMQPAAPSAVVSGFRGAATMVALPLIREGYARIALATAGRVGCNELLAVLRRDLATAEFLRLTCSGDSASATGMSVTATIGDVIEAFIRPMGAAVSDVDELLAFVQFAARSPAASALSSTLAPSSVASRLEEAKALRSRKEEAVESRGSSIDTRLEEARALLRAHDEAAAVPRRSSVLQRLEQASALLRAQITATHVLVNANVPSSVAMRLQQASLLVSAQKALVAAQAEAAAEPASEPATQPAAEAMAEPAAAQVVSSVTVRIAEARALRRAEEEALAAAEPVAEPSAEPEPVAEPAVQRVVEPAAEPTAEPAAEPATAQVSSVTVRIAEAQALKRAEEESLAAAALIAATEAKLAAAQVEAERQVAQAAAELEEMQRETKAAASDEAAGGAEAKAAAEARTNRRTAAVEAAAGMSVDEQWSRVRSEPESGDLMSVRHEVALARTLLRTMARDAKGVAEANVAAEVPSVADGTAEEADADAAAAAVKLASVEAAAADEAAAANELANRRAVEVEAAAAMSVDELRSRVQADRETVDLASARHEVRLVRTLLQTMWEGLPSSEAAAVGGVDGDSSSSEEEEEEVQFQQEAPGAIVDELARDKAIRA